MTAPIGAPRPLVLPHPVDARTKRLRKTKLSKACMADILQEICNERVVYNDIIGLAREMSVGKACGLALVTKILQDKDVRAFEVLARYLDHEGRHAISVDVEHFDKAAQTILQMAGVNVDENGNMLNGDFAESDAQPMVESTPRPLNWRQSGGSITGLPTPCEARPIHSRDECALQTVVPEVKSLGHSRKRQEGAYSPDTIAAIKKGDCSKNGGARKKISPLEYELMQADVFS